MNGHRLDQQRSPKDCGFIRSLGLCSGWTDAKHHLPWRKGASKIQQPLSDQYARTDLDVGPKKKNHNSFQCQELNEENKNTHFPMMFLQTQNKKSVEKSQHDFYRQQNSSLNQNTDAGRHHSGPVPPAGSSRCHRGQVIQQFLTPASVKQIVTPKQTRNVS